MTKWGMATDKKIAEFSQLYAVNKPTKLISTEKIIAVQK